MPCTRIATDLNLFSHLATGPKTGEELAQASGADKALIGIRSTLSTDSSLIATSADNARPRIRRRCIARWTRAICSNRDDQRVLSSINQCPHKDRVSYIGSGNSKALAAHTGRFDLAYRPLGFLPEYLRNTSFRNPEDNVDGPHQFAFNTKLKWFDWLRDHPTEFQNFNECMEGYREGRPPWIELFPAKQVVCDGARDADDILLIDIGGNLGHDLMTFKNAFPDVTGRLILPDLPNVIATVSPETSGKIETMGYDFFTEQPVKG